MKPLSNLPPGCTDAEIERRFGDPPTRTCPRCGGDGKEPCEGSDFPALLARWRGWHAAKYPGHESLDDMLIVCIEELEAEIRKDDDTESHCIECGGTGEQYIEPSGPPCEPEDKEER